MTSTSGGHAGMQSSQPLHRSTSITTVPRTKTPVTGAPSNRDNGSARATIGGTSDPFAAARRTTRRISRTGLARSSDRLPRLPDGMRSRGDSGGAGGQGPLVGLDVLTAVRRHDLLDRRRQVIEVDEPADGD